MIFSKELFDNYVGRRVHLIGDIGLFFEDDSVPNINKEEALKTLTVCKHDMTRDELIAAIWAIGKLYNNDEARKALKLFSDYVVDDDLGWQILISYENLFGNEILSEWKGVFEKLAIFAKNNEKILKALMRFSF